MFAALAISFWAALSPAPTSNVRPPQSQETKPPQAPYNARKTYPVEALREDLKLLWNMLDEGHGGFDRYTPKNVLRKRFDDAAAELAAPMTELDFYPKLLPLIAEIKDGHTRAQLSSPAGAFFDDQPVVFPFSLRFLEGKTFIFRNLSSDPGVQPGAELLSINGMTMAEILSELLPLIPSDAGIQIRKIRQLEFPAVFGRLFALRFGRPDSFRFLYYRALETKKDHYDLFRFTEVTAKEAEELPQAVRKNARGWFDVLVHPNLGPRHGAGPVVPCRGGPGSDLGGQAGRGGFVWTLPENQKRHPCFVVAPQSNVNWPCVIIQEGKRPELCPGQRLGEGARLAFEIVKAGGDPIYTEYAGVEHNSFMWAYTEPALVEWLFARQR